MALAALVALAGCRGKAATAAEADGGPGPAAAARAPTELLVDDEVVGRVAAGELARARPLAELLPGDVGAFVTWREILIHTADGRVAYVRQPAERHAGEEPLLERDGAGGVRFVLVRDARGLPPEVAEVAAARPSVSMDAVVKLEVRLAEPARAAATAAAHPLVIVDGATRRELSLADLEARPKVPAPGSVKERSHGWDLLALLPAGAPPARLSLLGRDGKTTTLEPAAFTRGERLLHLRFNRRGQARLRLWTLGPEPRIESEIEDLVEIRLGDAAR